MSAAHDQWWDQLDADLARYPARPELTFDPLRSSDVLDTYWLQITSLDGYVIAAWLTIPKGEGPFPAVMYPPSYMSVVVPAPYEYRARMVTMTVVSRGQRGADKPYAAAFPGHLTVGIEDPGTWIFRGVVADAIRAWEVLGELSQVDPDRMAIFGNDLGLLVNARRPGAKAVHVNGSFFYRMLENAGQTDAYPLEEINDHLRTWSQTRESVARTLDTLDPLHQAERVSAETLFYREQASPVQNDDWFSPLVSRFATKATFLDMTHRGQVDYDAVDAWLADQLGVQPFPRSWTPAEIGAWSI
ncbi:MAG TPA: acetylxylan esterase [Thermomicrobiales bacterium]|nr:acetylxylan esterase [Thermomicrobiales bacterium]